MTDPDLTPAQQESVRAVLASVKHTEPTPPHVVARLDETLADLVSQRRAVHAPVVTLASRRRRLASTLLLAAAAAVVFGVGITQVLPSGTESSNDSAGSSAESAEDQTTTQSDRSLDAPAPSGAESNDAGLEKSPRSTSEKEPLASTADSARTALTALTSSAALRPQVRALRPRVPSASSFVAQPDCLIDRTPSEDQVDITYNGLPGVLVYRPAVAERQQVDVYLCGVTEPLASVRLRAR